MTDTPELVKVARDLRELVHLAAALHAEALQHGDHPSLPGGPALVALAPTASVEAWEWRMDARERAGLDVRHREDEDPDELWPVLQTLRFWSEAWRVEHGAETDLTPTIATEAAFLTRVLQWAWDTEPHFEDMAADIGRARRKLEDILSEGERAERGVPCLYDECRGVRLVRKLEPYRDDDGERRWRQSDWHCPRCHREWDEDAYARMKAAAHEVAQVEVLAGEEWVTTSKAAAKVGRPERTVKTWRDRGHLAQVCVIAGRRKMVRLADVLARHYRKDEAA